MKIRNFRILGAALAVLLPACGGGGGGGGGSGNPAFPVTMTEPAAGQTFTAPATIVVSAVAADPASVAKVEVLGGVLTSGISDTGIIWSGGSVVATLAQPPFQATWTDVPAGIHTLVARVTDKAGALTFSNSITITVLAPGESPGGWMPIARVSGVEMSFVDTNRGWLTDGGLIQHTVDGGATWVLQWTWSGPLLNNCFFSLSGIQFVDDKRGWAVGSDCNAGVVVRTTTGGATWTSTSLAIRSPHLCFVDSDTGWVVGVGDIGSDKHIFATTDGGVTWTPLPTGIPGLGGLLAVRFVDRENGWVLGWGNDVNSLSQNLILRTTDGGLTWSEQLRTGPDEAFMALDFVSATTGWVSRVQIGGPPTNKGILFTNDAGATWTEQTYPGTDAIIALDFVSPTQGWGTGFSQGVGFSQAAIIHTEDGGASWVNQQIPLFVRSVQFVDANVGWALAEAGILLKTTTGGKAP